MSKNIYRVNKKSDLDEIMKNNFLKPICIIFVSKSMDKKLYDDIAISIKAISKQLTYSMILIIDFDDFIDNMNFFTTIKENVPHFIAYFKGKQMANCTDKDNFIPLIISLMDQIHGSYVNRLMNAFNQQEKQEKPEEVNQVNSEQVDNQVDKKDSNQTVQSNQVVQESKETKETKEPKDSKDSKKSKKSSKKVVNKSSEESEESESEQSEQSEQSATSEASESEEEKVEEIADDEVEEDEAEQSVHVDTRKKTNNINKISVHEDNTTEDIRLKKEKLKELKKLKEMLNK